LLQLGRVTILCGTLETGVNIAIIKRAGYEAVIDYRAVIREASSNFQQKIDIISALSEKLAPQYPNVKNYKSVIAKLQSAQKARNKYAHNAITTDQRNGESNAFLCLLTRRFVENHSGGSQTPLHKRSHRKNTRSNVCTSHLSNRQRN